MNQTLVLTGLAILILAEAGNALSWKYLSRANPFPSQEEAVAACEWGDLVRLAMSMMKFIGLLVLVAACK